MNTVTDDLRIKEIKELITPAALIADVPISPAIAETVSGCRAALHKILHGGDDRLIVVMGPCSIHDVKAAMEYANKLRVYREKYAEDLERQVLVGEYGAWRTVDLHQEKPMAGIFSEEAIGELMQLKLRLAEAAKQNSVGHFFWLLTS